MHRSTYIYSIKSKYKYFLFCIFLSLFFKWRVNLLGKHLYVLNFKDPKIYSMQKPELPE